MGMIQFVNNYDDLSTDKGYQFKFHCDKCGNGYMSRYQPSLTGTGGSLLRAAGDLFGGWLSSAGDSAYEIQRAVGGKAHDEALQKAVEDARRTSTSARAAAGGSVRKPAGTPRRASARGARPTTTKNSPPRTHTPRPRRRASSSTRRRARPTTSHRST